MKPTSMSQERDMEPADVRSGDAFHLLDLESQAEAVHALLAGRTLEEKIAWFKEHGEFFLLGIGYAGPTGPFRFVSRIGFQATFYIEDDALVFMGDNTTWTVPRSAAQRTVGAAPESPRVIR